MNIDPPNEVRVRDREIIRRLVPEMIRRGHRTYSQTLGQLALERIMQIETLPPEDFGVGELPVGRPGT